MCAYRGDIEILGAEWTRRINSKRKSKGLAGFENGIPYGRNGFSEPGSMTNLTVRMEVLSVDAEGEYICEFESAEEYFSNSVFLTVVGKATSCCMLMHPKYVCIFVFEAVLTSGVIWLSALFDITIGHQGAFKELKKKKGKMFCFLPWFYTISQKKKCKSPGKSNFCAVTLIFH